MPLSFFTADIDLCKIKTHPWFKEIDWNLLEQVRAAYDRPLLLPEI